REIQRVDAEALRVLYVALTRAERALVLPVPSQPEGNGFYQHLLALLGAPTDVLPAEEFDRPAPVAAAAPAGSGPGETLEAWRARHRALIARGGAAETRGVEEEGARADRPARGARRRGGAGARGARRAGSRPTAGRFRGRRRARRSSRRPAGGRDRGGASARGGAGGPGDRARPAVEVARARRAGRGRDRRPRPGGHARPRLRGVGQARRREIRRRDRSARGPAPGDGARP